MLRFLAKVKSFLSFVIFMVLLGAFLVFYSLYEERKHIENCEKLGVKCPPGKMHETVASFEELIEKTKKKL